MKLLVGEEGIVVMMIWDLNKAHKRLDQLSTWDYAGNSTNMIVRRLMLAPQLIAGNAQSTSINVSDGSWRTTMILRAQLCIAAHTNWC